MDLIVGMMKFWLYTAFCKIFFEANAIYKMVLAFFCFQIIICNKVVGQKNYAEELLNYSSEITTLTGCGLAGLGPCNIEVVQDPHNATGDNGEHSKLYSSPGLNLGIVTIGGYDGFLELEYPSIVSSGVPSYIRVDGEESLFAFGWYFGRLGGRSFGNSTGRANH